MDSFVLIKTIGNDRTIVETVPDSKTGIERGNEIFKTMDKGVLTLAYGDFSHGIPAKYQRNKTWI